MLFVTITEYWYQNIVSMPWYEANTQYCIDVESWYCSLLAAEYIPTYPDPSGQLACTKRSDK